MGTDIHCQVEYRIDGKWHWLYAELPEFIRTEVAQVNAMKLDRNYYLFEVLADVRGAGEIVPISKPRGLPEDISPELKVAHKNNWLLGDHSYSWVTGRELADYDWDTTKGGVGFHDWWKLSHLAMVSHRFTSENVRIVFGFDS